MSPWMVVIVSTDPDTGSSEREVYEVTPAPAPGTERAVLRQLVTGIHPDAIVGAEDGGRSSFTDGRRAITAFFEIDGTPTPSPAPPNQGSLFDS